MRVPTSRQSSMCGSNRMPEAISTAAQTLGRRTMEPEALKEPVEGKFG